MATKRIELTIMERMWHFIPAFFFLIISTFHIYSLLQYYWLNSYDGVETPIEMLRAMSFFLVIFIVLFYVQSRKLRYKVFEISVSEDHFQSALKKTAEELEWQIDKNEGGQIRAHRSWNLSSSWGELITIEHKPDTIRINSICDPNAAFVSLVSAGWNKKNVRTFIANLK